ncbi:hypothetical protein COL5a_011264 [Colletotrichum fioriniae]|uniref:Ecp2 effector protein domain-containing protein n=1 Tax=Colletotrichum fioriniae PJ7 TaxID=1445577 RepID=A0A010RYU9_9PEZI|nr:uncharacterized protein COL516b_003396 [Colletotrichum fioriniae]EXF77438.1 hypothetical protein CFIO01_05888 [Colletotrichum fioriniae PJ7]KAJ0308842.1 hypothetical protein COL516b_003396 [Colletotrichum fioriniae]KAJ0317121.1 hypothetical protein COL5a_011264 [Colletotrichum fioriniae]KAJ3940716.1 hypothetical protein N0V96_009730 [Colletotrichum fioriniae]
MLISLSISFSWAILVTVAWAFGQDAPSPGAPIPGYGIFIPRWEIPSPDGNGEMLSLRGTVEEVATQMRDMHPSFDIDDQFGKIAMPAIGKRATFEDKDQTLCHNFREGNRTAAHVSIDELRTVQGKPENGAGPANCGRAKSSKKIDSFGDIADGAQRVLSKCKDKLNANQGQGMTVSGQAFHKDSWNVVVRGGDNCDDAGVNMNPKGSRRLFKG